MTEKDEEYIRHGVIDLGRCYISIENLNRAGMLKTKEEKDNYEYIRNIYTTVNSMYNRLKNDLVPMNEMISTVSSLKGLIEKNTENIIEIIKPYIPLWEAKKGKHTR